MRGNPEVPDLIGTSEACRILNCHPSTLSRKVAAGELTPVHKLPTSNGAFLFNRGDIEALLKKVTA